MVEIVCGSCRTTYKYRGERDTDVVEQMARAAGWGIGYLVTGESDAICPKCRRPFTRTGGTLPGVGQ